MNEVQLETFLAVVHYGSYSKAADALYLSQPTVSYRMQSLEEELGVKLFAHRNFQAGLTEAGEAFVPEAESLCVQMKAIRKKMMLYSPEHMLTIGFPEMMLQGDGRVFMTVMQLIPDQSAQMTSRVIGRPPEDVQQLLRGEVDLIFTDLTQPELESRRFGKRRLFSDKSHVCMRADHALAQETSLTLDRLHGEHILDYDDKTYFLTHIRSQLEAHHVAMQGDAKLSFVQQMPVLKQLNGVMITNQPPVSDPGIVSIPLQLEQQIDIGVAWRKADCPPALQQLLHALAMQPDTLWE